MQTLPLHTVAFLMNETEILLGLKKRGFGKNYLLGIGGKVENGETLENAARREVTEEIQVTLSTIRKVGRLDFYFPHVENGSWDLQIHVFTATHWTGVPQETDEIKPAWFQIQDIPYAKMWDDARYWLPLILAGQSIAGTFRYTKELKVSAYTITPLYS